MLPALKTFLPMAEKLYDKKSTLDILQYLCVSDGKMIYTDLETVIKMPVADKRCFTLPVTIIKKVLGSKPQSLRIDVPEKNKLNIAYDNKQITFPVANVEEFPALTTDEFKEISQWPAEIFHKLHKQIPYASTDMLRPALTGIYVMQNKKNLSSIATDGHILQWITEMETDGKNKFECIIPVVPIQLVSRFNRGEVKISLSEKHIRFTFNKNIQITTKLINEKYPDFMKVIPELNGNELVVEKKELVQGIKSALPFANKTNHHALFTGNNGFIRIQVEDREEKISYESSCPVLNKKGKELKMALDLQLLEKTVKGLDEEHLHWYYGSPDDPSLFTNGNGVKNLIMPRRMNEQ